MSYVENNLSKGEVIKYQGKVSLWSLAPGMFFGVLLLAAYGFGVIILAMVAITYYTTELAITNKRIIAKFGFISRTTIELNLNKVESVQVIQSLFGRIFNYGDIVVAGAGNPQAPIRKVSSPIVFRNKVFDEQEKIELEKDKPESESNAPSTDSHE